MSEAVFRSAPESVPESSTPTPPVITGGGHLVHGLDALEHGPDSIEPVQDVQLSTLKAMGIESEINDLPQVDKENLKEVGDYVAEVAKSRGLALTDRAMSRVLTDLKFEMGIDQEAEPSAILDKIGGLVKSWKSIAFIKDSRDRRSLFMKLARQPDSRAMDALVLGEMEKRRIYAS